MLPGYANDSSLVTNWPIVCAQDYETSIVFSSAPIDKLAHAKSYLNIKSYPTIRAINPVARPRTYSKQTVKLKDRNKFFQETSSSKAKLFPFGSVANRSRINCIYHGYLEFTLAWSAKMAKPVPISYPSSRVNLSSLLRVEPGAGRNRRENIWSSARWASVRVRNVS